MSSTEPISWDYTNKVMVKQSFEPLDGGGRTDTTKVDERIKKLGLEKIKDPGALRAPDQHTILEDRVWKLSERVGWVVFRSQQQKVSETVDFLEVFSLFGTESKIINVNRENNGLKRDEKKELPTANKAISALESVKDMLEDPKSVSGEVKKRRLENARKQVTKIYENCLSKTEQRAFKSVFDIALRNLK